MSAADRPPPLSACPTCGTQLASDDRFCRSCGAKTPFAVTRVRTRLDPVWLGGLVVVACVAVLVSLAVVSNLWSSLGPSPSPPATGGDLGCGVADQGAPQISDQAGSFPGDEATVRLEARCASLTVTTAPGAAWGVAVTGTEDAQPSVTATADELVVRSPDGPTAFPSSTRKASWAVTLGTDPRLDLGLALDASEANVNLGGATLTHLAVGGNAIGDTRLDLDGATVEQLDVSVNAATISIALPAGADMKGRVEGNAASVRLCAAAGVGLRLLVEEDITASNNYNERGLVNLGNVWESPDYATAATQVELRTTGSAVSYELNPESGCK